MKFFSYILLCIIVLLGVSFAILNAEAVNIHYYIGSADVPLSLLLVITLGIGVLLGMLSGIGMFLRLRRENRQLRSRAKLAEKEVENLRAIPVKGSH